MSGDAASTLTAALAESFVAHRAPAEALARRILGDASLAEDAVQIAFTQILVRLRSGDRSLLTSNPRAVVLHGTRWAALKLAERNRDRHAAVPLSDTLPAADDALDHAELRLVSTGIVATLPPHYRDVLVLRYLEDQPDERAAARLTLTVKAYRRRLDRARVAARRAASRSGVTAFMAAVHLRVRGWEHRIDARVRQVRVRMAQLLGGPGFSHWAMFAALVGLTAGVLAPVSGAPSRARGTTSMALRDASVSAGAPSVPASSSTPPGAAQLAGNRAPTARPSSPASPLPMPSPGVQGVDQLFGQASPDDVRFLQLAAAPHYAQNHAIVASTMGYGCACSLGMLSLDGGASWNSFPLPQGNGQPTIALPPSFPDDPRIFLGYAPPEQGGDCVLAHAGAPTCDLLPLSGRLQVDASFDDGFPVVYGATARVGIFAYDMSTHVLRLLAASPYDLDPMIAAPSGVTTTALYIRTLGTNSAGSRMRLVACTRSFQCVQRTEGGLGALILDGDDPSGSVLSIGWVGDSFTQVGLSLDGGRSVSSVVVDGDWITSTAFTDAAGHFTMWAVTSTAEMTGYAVLWSRQGTGQWNRVPLGFPVTGPLLMLPLSDGRLIVTDLGGAGLWCTLDMGATWAHRCPTR